MDDRNLFLSSVYQFLCKEAEVTPGIVVAHNQDPGTPMEISAVLLVKEREEFDCEEYVQYVDIHAIVAGSAGQVALIFAMVV